MFVSDELVFLQLQKTAGTHIAAVLTEHLGGEMRGKHGPLDFDPGDRLIVGSVRNPWDWYVSLWAYGCGAEGGVQGLLKFSRFENTKRLLGQSWRSPAEWPTMLGDLVRNARRDVHFWRDVYSDPRDPERFRRWLHAILSPEGRKLLGADYSQRPLRNFAGFFTYRFLSVFTPSDIWQRNANAIRQHADIGPFVDAHCAPEIFIRNENLEDDLAQVFATLGRSDIDADTLKGRRTNASKRGKAAEYYDEEAIGLVAKSDPFFVEKFGYMPPQIHAQ